MLVTMVSVWPWVGINHSAQLDALSASCTIDDSAAFLRWENFDSINNTDVGLEFPATCGGTSCISLGGGLQ